MTTTPKRHSDRSDTTPALPSASPPAPLPVRPPATRPVWVLALAMLALLAPSCHPMRGSAPDPALAADMVRVRLHSQLDAATLTCDGLVSIRGGGGLAGSYTGRGDITVRRRGSAWIINGTTLYAPRLEVQSLSAARPLGLGKTHYRGRFVLRPAADSPTAFAVDNHLPLEQYLAGVLARELPGGWHAEAFKAQAVAARTYALYEMTHGGAGRDFDVYDDQSSQVYGGVEAESYKAVAAVTQTRGLVLAWRTPAGAMEIFKTYFSSTCGGVTNPVEALASFDPAPTPLAGGVHCTGCAGAPRYRWGEVRVSKDDAYAALVKRYEQLGALMSLRQVKVTSQTDSGRPLWLELVGEAGRRDAIRAEDLRLVLLRYGPPACRHLYSATCRIVDEGEQLRFTDGRGYGHGVGMCQYGAESMAAAGRRYYEILYKYYPGAVIMEYAPLR